LHIPPFHSPSLPYFSPKDLIPDFKDYKSAFSELYTSNSKVLNRMRLTCQSIVPSSLVLATAGSPRAVLETTTREATTPETRPTREATTPEPTFPADNAVNGGTGDGNGTLHVEDFTLSGVEGEGMTHAMNEVILHRGRSPHLTRLDISIDGVFLTEAIVSPLSLPPFQSLIKPTLSPGITLASFSSPCLL
jgi:NADH kinase